MMLDAYPNWKDDGLVGDNFGTPGRSIEPFPLHDQIGIAPLMLTPAGAPENRWHFGLIGAAEVVDGYAAIDFMLNDGGVVTLARLANLRSQPLSIQHDWRGSFCLVVGDSFIDRLSCWNAGLLYDDARSQVFKTLRVPTSALADQRKVNSLAQFIRRNNWLGGNNGPSRISIRTASVDAADLAAFQETLRTVTHSIVEVQAIGSVDDCCPAAGNIFAGRTQVEKSEQTEAAIREDGTSLTIAQPYHLRYCTGHHPIYVRGTWSLDLAIDRTNDNGRYSNVRESWVLPSKPQIVKHFLNGVAARVMLNGRVSCHANSESQPLSVAQPSDETVFWELMTQPQRYWYPDLRSNEKDERTYRASRVSDKGRYLLGVIGLFGSLNEFEQTMSTRFWQSTFLKLATPGRDQHDEVIRDLQRRLLARDGVLTINDDAGWQNLAERVIQKGSRLRAPRHLSRYANLLKAWTAELQQAVDADPHMKEREAEIMSEAPDDLRRSLTYLVQRDVFYPGHEWSCRRCRHRNWLGVDSLSKVMSCEVCGSNHPLPADLALDFRLNEFFATCLREHDSLTVAWALCAIRDTSSSFAYIPQTELFRDYPENQGNRSDRELDILCLVDGKFVVGEGKAKVDLIRQSDLEELAAAVQEVRADVAVMAALEGTADAMREKATRLRQLLPASIEVRTLLCDWAAEPTWHLPY